MAWLSGYNFRKSHIINPASGAGSYYQVRIKAYYDKVEIFPWEKYENNPVLSPEGDEDYTTWAYVLKVGSTFHMYYTYHDASDFHQIGHATSINGKTWTKDTVNNPVLTSPGVGCWVPCVWIENDVWYMIFTEKQSGPGVIKKAHSSDGITWTVDTTILEKTTGQWDYTGIENGGIIKVGSTYFLFYNTLWGTERQSGIATTTDQPDSWTANSFIKDVNNPIFVDGRFCGFPFKMGSFYYFLVPHYTIGSDYSVMELYRDINPTFYPSNREFLGDVIRYGDTLDWDGLDIDVPCVLTDNIYRDTYNATNNELWCYYSGYVGGLVNQWREGMTIESNIELALALPSDTAEHVGLGKNCKNDFSDIRFTKADGETKIPYWIEYNEYSRVAYFWVKIPDDLSSNPQTIYIYYGNPGASSESKITDTFIKSADGIYGDLDEFVRGSAEFSHSDNKYKVTGNNDNADAWAAGTLISDWKKYYITQNISETNASYIEFGLFNYFAASGLLGSSTNNDWRAVCYGNGLFVAVASSGSGNRVMTSPDGINWTIRTSAANNEWRGVCFGDGLFVAVATTGSGNRVMTSPDGINWTIRTSAADLEWRSVCYGEGLFVAVASSGTGNRVMTSPNGIDWTIRSSAADNNWYSVCSGYDIDENFLFIAVATSGTYRIMTSPDGIAWTSRTNPAAIMYYAICYGFSPSNDPLYVAVAGSGSGNRVMTSPDGLTWTSRDSAGDFNWVSVCYGDHLFVAVASTGAGNRVMTSPDGVNWTLRASGNDSNSWTSVCFGDNKYIGVANYNKARAMLSTNGTTWISTICGNVDISRGFVIQRTINKTCIIYSPSEGNYKYWNGTEWQDSVISFTSEDNLTFEIWSDEVNVYGNVKKNGCSLTNVASIPLASILSFNRGICFAWTEKYTDKGYADQQVDNIFIRNYVSPEPQHSTWGQSESETGIVYPAPLQKLYVKYYEMIGDEPDPENDTYLGQSEVITIEGLTHSIQVNFSNGSHTIYTIVEDLFGNRSPIIKTISFTVNV